MMRYTKEYSNSLPKFDRSVSLLSWAYNEEELIGNYLRKANELLKYTVEDYEIIIVDDCSTDRTNEIIKSLMGDIPQIKLIENQVNMNVGYSSQKAIMNSTKEYLFWQTVDWSYDISDLRIFLELLRSYDVVAGVRREPVKAADKIIKPFLGVLKLFNIKHLTKRSDTLSKAIVSILNYCLIRCFFGVPLSDYQNVVFYPTKLIQSINFESKSSFSNPEGLIKAYWGKAMIVEVPISFLPRQMGQPKGTRLKAIIAAIWDISRLWFKWVLLGKRATVTKGRIERLNLQAWDLNYE